MSPGGTGSGAPAAARAKGAVASTGCLPRAPALAPHLCAPLPTRMPPRLLPVCVASSPSYLPDATVAFVDEIFKANSAILNTLLTLLNERLFDNGATRVPVPLLCLVRMLCPSPCCAWCACCAWCTRCYGAARSAGWAPAAGRRLWRCQVGSLLVAGSCTRWPGPLPRTLACALRPLPVCPSSYPLRRRLARPTSCQRARSWMRCTTASCCAARCRRCRRRACWKCCPTAAGASRCGAAGGGSRLVAQAARARAAECGGAEASAPGAEPCA